MNQIGYVHFEVEKNGRKYLFAAPIGAPLDEASDSALAIFQQIRELQKNMSEEAKKQKENVPVEVVSQEPIMQ